MYYRWSSLFRYCPLLRGNKCTMEYNLSFVQRLWLDGVKESITKNRLK